ncbi:hypothetical protein [Paractinoplanes brasiliensis]|uniref:Uncharacterized protein n=1 Tax=Paractinoplanes brasiliensis TaxID=52695 RepID=A0A4R6K1C7_9ACTN|nr:hypothetical protein [Actinoplanes brasiliensis]TDO40905.1 hypothetical protein C8E87_4625 [Actinoplanes brasiliensis]GID25973.1 hypothetical protein Abr02nite_09560 [Actinoplanes brasiliensis]
MERQLELVLAVVLMDVDGLGGIRLRAEDDDWLGMEGVATAMLRWPDGSGRGVQVALDQEFGTQVAMLADQVQEEVVEALWHAGRPTNWPRCPRHPHTHPLAAAEHGGRAYWKCPAGGELISEIGRLGATPRG